MQRSYKIVMLGALMCASASLYPMENKLNNVTNLLNRFAANKTEENRLAALSAYNQFKTEIKNNRGFQTNLAKRLTLANLDEATLNREITATRAPATTPATGAPTPAPVPAAPPVGRTPAEEARLKKLKADLDAAEEATREASQALTNLQEARLNGIRASLQNLSRAQSPQELQAQLKNIMDRMTSLSNELRAAGRTNAVAYINMLMQNAQAIAQESEELLYPDLNYIFSAEAEAAPTVNPTQVQQQVDALIGTINGTSLFASVTELRKTLGQLQLDAQAIANATAAQRKAIRDALTRLTQAIGQKERDEKAKADAATAEQQRKAADEAKARADAAAAQQRAADEAKVRDDAKRAAQQQQQQVETKGAAAGGALSAGEWQQLKDLAAQIDSTGTLAPADATTFKALLARAKANPRQAGDQTTIYEAADASAGLL
jgi:hypothetical protein